MSTSPPSDRLGVFGDLALDVVVRAQESVRFGGDTAATIERRRGGAAATTAAVAASLGRLTTLFTASGTGPLADWLIAEMAASGADVVSLQCPGEPDTVVVVVGSDGERTMFPDRRCQPQRPPIEFDDLATLGWLHATSYGLADGDAMFNSLERAVAADIPISIDVSSTQVIENHGDELIELCRVLRPAVVLANGAEAAMLELGADRGLPGARATVVKKGPLGAEWRQPEAATVTLALEHPLPISVNTTGAGDAFAGGLLHAAMSGADRELSLGIAHQAATDWLASRETAVAADPTMVNR